MIREWLDDYPKLQLVPYSSISIKKNKKLGWGIWVAGFPRWIFYLLMRQISILKKKYQYRENKD